MSNKSTPATEYGQALLKLANECDAKNLISQERCQRAFNKAALINLENYNEKKSDPDIIFNNDVGCLLMEQEIIAQILQDGKLDKLSPETKKRAESIASGALLFQNLNIRDTMAQTYPNFKSENPFVPPTSTFKP